MFISLGTTNTSEYGWKGTYIREKGKEKERRIQVQKVQVKRQTSVSGLRYLFFRLFNERALAHGEFFSSYVILYKSVRNAVSLFNDISSMPTKLKGANMIGKQNQPIDNEDNQLRIKSIANKRKFLEEKSAQVQAEIRSCFEEIAEVLRSRERQLLRQAEAIHGQQLSLVETSLDFLPSSIVVLDGKRQLEERIRRFGNIETHGSNGITVKDVEPYKVADYQDANKDHVSFDKSITYQKVRDHLSRCKDFVSDYRTSHISSLSSAFLIEDQLRDSRNVKGNALTHFNNTLPLSRCSPLLLVKRKLGLTHVSLDGLHAFGRACPRNVRSFEMSCKTTESCGLDTLMNETTEADLRELNKEISDQDDSELIRCPKEQEKNYEHPMQVQQWLRQILAETEIEPAIHEMGQFSEISRAKLCNEL